MTIIMKNLIRLIFSIITFTILASVAYSCSSDNNEEIPDVPTERTVLVYIVANNTLSSNAVADLEEMELGASRLPKNARWIVYYAPGGKAPSLLELKSDGSWLKLKQYPTTGTSVSLERMTAVIADTRSVAPASNYGIVLWSHASGWLENGIVEPEVSTLSFGDDGGRYMNITTLRHILEQYKMEFIYADCCNLASVEVAYELRNCAKLLAGSAIQLPAAGMPYDITLPMLANGDVISAAKATFNYYSENKAEKYPFCTLSVIDLAKMGELASETAAAYKSSAYPSNYKPAYLGTGNCRFFDLKHFVDALSPENIQQWNNILAKTVLYAANLQYLDGFNIEVKAHCGLSTFILKSAEDATVRNYNHLQWYNDVSRFQPY